MIRRMLAAASAAVMMITAVPVSALSDQAGESYTLVHMPVNDLESYDMQYGVTDDKGEELFSEEMMSKSQTLAAASGSDSVFIRTSSAYTADEAFSQFSNPEGAKAFFSDMLSWSESYYNGTVDGYDKTFRYSNGNTETVHIIDFDFSEYELSLNEAEAAYAMLRNACPLSFFFTRSVTFSSVGGVPTYLFPHLDENYKTAASRAEVRATVSSYIASYSEAANEKSLYHKAKFIHDKEINEMSYAFKADGYTAEDAEWAHSIIGPMTQKKGVCEAYSRTYEMLVNYYGGEAMYVSGQAGGWNPKLGQTSWGPHAWNVIKLDDGKYYLTDVTFDDPVITYSDGTVGSDLRYDYFAKGTAAFENTHKVTQPFDLTQSSINPLNYQYPLPVIPTNEFSLTWLESYLNHEHKYSSAITKSPTCTEEGIMTYTCTVCGDSYTESIPMREHEYQTVRTVNSTCVVNGYTLCRCKNCSKEITIDIKPLVAHNYVSEVSVQPTCTEAGERLHTCTVCGNKRTEVIPALGHDLKKYYTEPSTCVAHGYTVYRCSRCDYEENGDEKPLSGHSYSAEITSQANCRDTGSVTYTCTVCGDSYTEIIPTGDHSYELVEIVPPTCTENGYSVYVCTICGDRTTRDAVPAKGHSLTHIPGQAASCEQDGFTGYWKCAYCSELFADRSGEVQITAPEVIPALGHCYEFLTRVEPTYDQEGYELWVCTHDPDHVRRDIISKKERSLSDARIILARDVCEYTSRAVTPRVKVFFEDVQLIEGTDYELRFENNTEIGARTAKAVVTGIGRFTGEAESLFSIVPEENSFNAVNVQGDGLYLRWEPDQSADGYEIQYSRDPAFPEDKTFTGTITGKNTTDTGSMPEAGGLWYVRVRSFVADGEDHFGVWSAARSVRVNGVIGSVTVSHTSYTYTGRAIAPSVTVTDKAGRVLKNGTDYRLYYLNNTNVGTATVRAVGIGRYSGSVSARFAIIPEKIRTLTAVSTAGGTLAVTVSDITKGTRGVVIEVSKDPYFIDEVKTVTVSGAGRRSAQIRGLESGGIYYVRAKAFTEMLGTPGKLGDWSAVKTVSVR